MRRLILAAVATSVAAVPLLIPAGAAEAAAGPGITVASTCLGTPGTIHMHAVPTAHGTVHADVSVTGISATQWSGLLTWDLAGVKTAPLTSYDGSTGSIIVSGDSTVQNWPAVTYAGFQVTDMPSLGCTIAAAHSGPNYFLEGTLWGATVVASRKGSVGVFVQDVRRGEKFTVIARVKTNHGWQRRSVKVVSKRALRLDKVKVGGFSNLAAFQRAEFIVVRPSFGERYVFSMSRG